MTSAEPSGLCSLCEAEVKWEFLSLVFIAYVIETVINKCCNKLGLHSFKGPVWISWYYAGIYPVQMSGANSIHPIFQICFWLAYISVDNWYIKFKSLMWIIIRIKSLFWSQINVSRSPKLFLKISYDELPESNWKYRYWRKLQSS